MNVSNVEITAGLGGFLVLFGMGLVVWFLGRDLSRRLRRMRQREELRIRNVQATTKEPPTSKDDVPASEQTEQGHGEPQDPRRSLE